MQVNDRVIESGGLRPEQEFERKCDHSHGRHSLGTALRWHTWPACAHVPVALGDGDL